MPPRKSDASKGAAAAATGDEGTPMKESTPREGVNVEDLNLPKSIVTRLAKGVLPPNTQIQGNAMLAMTKSATVFVNYLATHANENAVTQNRKTIAPGDVFKALEDLEFPDFKPRLEMELARFNELQANKRNAYKQKVAAADKSAGGDPADEEGANAEGPAAKKARMSGGQAGLVGDAGADGEAGEEEEDEHDEEPEPEDDEDEDEQDQEQENEREDGDEAMEEEQEAEDEALDNGEDSE